MRTNWFLLLIMINSCITREESTYSKSFFLNNTIHTIKIMPFKNGMNDTIKSLIIPENGKILLTNVVERGKGGGSIYSEELIGGFYDSVMVIFDGSFSNTHYNYIHSSKLLGKPIIYADSNRSLYNRNNYLRTIINESKYSITNEYTYTFTEQDYFDAQK